MKLLDFLEANDTCTQHCVGRRPEDIKTKQDCWWYTTYPEEYAFAKARGWLQDTPFANPICNILSYSGRDIRRQLKGDFS